MSAAARAEARRKAILSRGTDRLAKLTTSGRGEDAAYAKDVADPPLPSFPPSQPSSRAATPGLSDFLGESTPGMLPPARAPRPPTPTRPRGKARPTRARGRLSSRRNSCRRSWAVGHLHLGQAATSQGWLGTRSLAPGWTATRSRRSWPLPPVGRGWLPAVVRGWPWGWCGEPVRRVGWCWCRRRHHTREGARARTPENARAAPHAARTPGGRVGAAHVLRCLSRTAGRGGG
ncbi:hypothetical protein B0H10DRAFT_119384 [Mycena sp. CBHHK59/15]|nr:hypothetical protein B0H10DRAFT_119384 [Mycena sp. CBHHK59/15]